jgi:hypothetical protein
MKTREWAKILAFLVAMLALVEGYHLWSRRVIKHGIGRFADNLKAAGFLEALPLRGSLAAAVSSHNQAEILRAFNRAVYAPNSRKAGVAPILRDYLNDPDPFVRLSAAEDLTIMGDTGGEETLIALVKESNAIAGIGQDVRMSAAKALAKYRVYASVPAIQQLYARTQYSQLLDDLSTLGAQSLDEKTYPYVASANTIIEYGETKETRFLPQIESTFRKARQKDWRVAAAWTLATLTGEKEALDYLREAAQEIASDTVVLDGSDEALDRYQADLLALKCLGTIRDPAAKRVLDTALGSRTQICVTTALVNLVLNQGGSDRATQVIVDQLEKRGPPIKWQPWEVVTGLAERMPDNPEVQRAGRDFSKNDENASWDVDAAERGQWPVYTWADDYLIEWVGDREASCGGAGLVPSPRT